MKRILYIVFFVCLSFSAYSQEYCTVSGYVKDKKTGEVLIGALLYEKTHNKGVITNGYGYYSFSLPAGKYTLSCSYLGYETENFDILLAQHSVKDIFLSGTFVDIGTVTITAEKSEDPIRINEFNTEKFTPKSISQMPSMFGEADVIKTIQLQSGVKTLGDGSSGMFIRGGSSDQNLILIDEAPIYNPSHLFGLISVFNPDALNYVYLYKSNMPAQYGGRVSSVIDCKMKEGNMYEHVFSAGISPFSGIVTASGPIVQEKSSFFVSGRKSLIDLVFTPGANMALVPSFYDINLKLNTKIGTKNRLFLSFYNGKDVIESLDGFYNKWGNILGTVRWSRNIGSKLFLKTSFIMSDYQNYLQFKDEQRDYTWRTGVHDMNLKCDLTYYVRPGNEIKVGAGSIYHRFIPGETSDSLQNIPRIQAFEHAFYLLNDRDLFSWLGLNYGLRLSAFQNYGTAMWFDYDQQYVPADTNTNQNGAYKTFMYAEPRISANVKLNSEYSLKLAYARNVQYMQMLQNNSLSYSSLETWFPANPNISPIIADIISIAWFQQLSTQYFFSTELYYKKYHNQLDFVDHARIVNNPYIEGEVRKGEANAYGVEFNVKKEIGRLTGNISYTYSKAVRKIHGINDNEVYNSPYDIPHDFRINAQYKINTNWSLSAVWMYMSGRPATFPVGFYEYQDNTVPLYTQRNAGRFPDYHRLDISCNYKPKQQETKLNWSMNFGIWNVYAKKNPLGYEFYSNTANDEIKVYQYTLFTILPTFVIKAEF
ncbi:MAG: TonB-dependent receptor [Bacteroidales bacterium]|jgi:hypothetical protein|nr:TonB-dependent receptor [Bacteroidales bacterium]